MKLICFCFLFLLPFVGLAFPDSTATIYSWKLSEYYDDYKLADIDTSLNGFQHYNPFIKNNYLSTNLGAIGSGMINNDFFNRQDFSIQFIFNSAYYEYFKTIKSTQFYDTKKPFTIIAFSIGPKKEEVLNLLHTQNINKNVNAGFTFDMYRGEGKYYYQITRNKSFSIFTNIFYRRYTLHADINLNSVKLQESGGYVDSSFFDGSAIKPTQIPLIMNINNKSKSENHSRSFFLSQKLNISSLSEIADKDSLLWKIKNYNDVSCIVHSFEYKEQSRFYKEEIVDTLFYDNIYIDSAKTSDEVFLKEIINTLQWRINAKSNAKIRIGGRLLLGNEIKDYSYYLFNKSIYSNYAAISLFNQAGKILSWDITGKYYFNGFYEDNLLINSIIKKKFGEELDASSVSLKGSFTKTSPDYLLQNYYSNHFAWTNEYPMKEDKRVQLEYNNIKYKFYVGASIGLVKNYIYFDTLSMPNYCKDEVQIYSATIGKDFKLGNWYSINKILYQKSDRNEIVNLPEWMTYNSIYYQKMFKFKTSGGKLLTQIGVDLYYQSQNYISAYMPAIGQFYNQNERKLGDYLFVDFYINFKVKRTRFFLKYDHLNSGFTDARYFNALNYPANDRSLKFGLSWTFYD